MVPFGENLSIQPRGKGPKTPLSNPWHWKSKYTEGKLEGYEPPVWILVFADDAPFEKKPPAGQPKKSYKIEKGSLVPISGAGPTDDVYFVLKTMPEQSRLKFVGEGARWHDRILFDDEVLIENVNEVTEGTVFTLPGWQPFWERPTVKAGVGVIGVTVATGIIGRWLDWW